MAVLEGLLTPPRPPAPPATPKAGRRAWLALAILALPCVVYAMDLTVLNLALPAISADLHPSGTELLWIVDVYGFVVAGALVTMGALGDRIGARRLLLIGAAGFAAASVMAAFASSAPMLIAARALLGLAGAVIAPSTLSLIRSLFDDPRERTTAIGIWVTSYSAGAAIGPLAGGALLDAFWWGSVLLLAVPVMALVLVIGPRLLPPDRPVAAGRLDLASAGLSLAAVLASVYGLKRLVVTGDLAGSLPWLAAGAGLGAAFARRQLTLADPLIDLRLLRVPAFATALITNLVAFFVVFGMSLFLAQYLQSVLGLTPLEAGVWMVPEALGFVAGSMVTPRLAGHMTTPALIAGGLLTGGAGYAVVATGGGLAAVIGGTTFAAVGLAAVATLAVDAAVTAAPPERAGVASATAETSSELGGALGIATLGAIGAAVFHGALPAGAPDTVGAALAAGAGDVARNAFAGALTTTAAISAGLLLITGLWSLARLHPHPTHQPERTPAC